MAGFTEIQLDSIARELSETGACVLPHALPEVIVRGVCEEIAAWREKFREASVGKTRELQPEIRSDRTLWWDFSNLTPVQREMNDYLTALREGLNQRLYLGLWDVEGHYAVYPEGAFYRTHLDRFKDDSARTVSVVAFFNRAWVPEHEGELRLEVNGESRKVPPKAGTMVIFLSDRIPHEVLPTRAERLSFASWFRRRT